MRYYLIAGEASGDLHGGNLMKGLLRADPQAVFRFWGGDKMKEAGGEPVTHIRDLAFMGFWEVLVHLPQILSNISRCKEDILRFKPDVVILIDYPGFNFRLLHFLKQNGIKIFYYISPQLWAWKTGRVKQVRKYVDRMFVIFPFEVDFYRQHGIKVDYCGHPLLDAVIPQMKVNEGSKTIALLPGSRKQEISSLLPEYLKLITLFPDYHFVVAGMDTIGEDFYREIMKGSRAELRMNATYDMLRQARAAVVTSGTATLETALHHVPEVVCYKGSWISYYVARALIKNIKYICIVNLICDKRVVAELIQADVNTNNLSRELMKILSPEGQQAISADYDTLVTLLGKQGASERIADLMVNYLKESNQKILLRPQTGD